MRKLSFKQKEVINLKDGKKLGYVADVDADLETGNIKAIIVPTGNRFANWFGSSHDIIIPWENIEKIGEETILVNY